MARAAPRIWALRRAASAMAPRPAPPPQIAPAEQRPPDVPRGSCWCAPYATFVQDAVAQVARSNSVALARVSASWRNCEGVI
jgi:hypothetical protein